MTQTPKAAGAETFGVRTADGRALHVLTAGPADGLPLVYHSGTPSGLVPFEPMAEAAAALGLRLVTYARPGYGESDPQPGRRVADAAADVITILDQLGAGRCVTVGWSGGGPHALATGALLGDRCLAAATIAGVAPYRAEGLDFLAGMGEENIEEFGAAEQGEAPLSAFLAEQMAALSGVTGPQVAEALGGLVTAVDQAALTGRFAEYQAASFRAALSTGIAGWRDDDLAFVADWGFALADLRLPVSIWQGDQDAMVPFAHGQWLAAHIPGARAHLLPGEGHLSLGITRIGDVLAELTDLAGGR
ncbi:MAG: alpha/beta fold hydrolase [Streptosporangiaceae bacterium]